MFSLYFILSQSSPNCFMITFIYNCLDHLASALAAPWFILNPEWSASNVSQFASLYCSEFSLPFQSKNSSPDNGLKDPVWVILREQEINKTQGHFPDGSDGKESACHACRGPGLIPGLGRSPGEGNGYPLQYSCLENSMDRGAWWATVHGES